MAQASLTRAHNKIQELSWEPTFVQRAHKYPTDYRLDRLAHGLRNEFSRDPQSGLRASFLVLSFSRSAEVFPTPCPKQAGELNGPAKPLEPHAHLVAQSVG